jgi:hypothetical protein
MQKNESVFGTPVNTTKDSESSTQSSIAVDSKDNVWVAWKSDWPIPGAPDVDNLVIYLAGYTYFTDDPEWFLLSSNPGWSFLPSVAVNSEDKVMTIWANSTGGQYMSRLYDPATRTMSPQYSLNIGLCVAPWHMFFSRLVAHGKDFYAAVLTQSRILYLLKFNETTSTWEQFAEVSDRAVEMMGLYAGFDNILVAWNSYAEPTGVFLTTVSVENPFSRIRIKSVSNLKVERKEERNFFHSYILNALNWTVNPENTEKGITVINHRIYRKTRTDDDTKWTRLTEIAGTVYKYDDRNVPASSDYVYAVTCVDDNQLESKVF